MKTPFVNELPEGKQGQPVSRYPVPVPVLMGHTSYILPALSISVSSSLLFVIVICSCSSDRRHRGGGYSTFLGEPNTADILSLVESGSWYLCWRICQRQYLIQIMMFCVRNDRMDAYWVKSTTTIYNATLWEWASIRWEVLWAGRTTTYGYSSLYYIILRSS